jgi:hypothetical protein
MNFCVSFLQVFPKVLLVFVLSITVEYIVYYNLSIMYYSSPIDVIKTRMQVDGELQATRSVGEQMQNRYYKGLVRGSLRIVREEGLAGLMRGAVPGTLRDVTYSGMRIVSSLLYRYLRIITCC